MPAQSTRKLLNQNGGALRLRHGGGSDFRRSGMNLCQLEWRPSFAGIYWRKLFTSGREPAIGAACQPLSAKSMREKSQNFLVHPYVGQGGATLPLLSGIHRESNVHHTQSVKKYRKRIWKRPQNEGEFSSSGGRRAADRMLALCVCVCVCTRCAEPLPSPLHTYTFTMCVVVVLSLSLSLPFQNKNNRRGSVAAH